MKTCPKCGELVGESAEKCFKCFFNFSSSEEEYKKAEQQRQQKILQAEQQRKQELLQIKLKEMGDLSSLNDLYEYDVVSIVDTKNGNADIGALKETLKSHSEKGWRLVNTVTNELGKNSSTAGGFGTNSTIDETVLIFERCIWRHK